MKPFHEAFPSPLCIKLPHLMGYTKYFNNDNRYVDIKNMLVIFIKKYSDYYAYLSTILLDSIIFNSNNKHYPQIFLEKCLHAVSKKVLLRKYIDKSNSVCDDF